MIYYILAYIVGGLLLSAWEVWDYRYRTVPQPSWKRIGESCVKWTFPVLFILWLPRLLLALAAWLSDYLRDHL